MSDLDFSHEFIQENKKLGQTMPKPRQGGPHTRHERAIRREEVYRLHFDYGYSARKISDLMQINRNTINVDIDYWYSKIKQNKSPVTPKYGIIEALERLGVQRTRLREQIDKAKIVSEKIAIERLLFEVDSKIWYIYQRFTESEVRVHSLATQLMNKWFKQNKRNERAITYFDTLQVSKKAKEKIVHIIKEDKSRKY